MSKAAGLPLASPIERRSSTESCTSATSDSRTAAPFRHATSRGRYSLAKRSWSLVPSSHARSGPWSWPLGRLTLALASTARTSSSPIPYRARALGLSSTRTAGSELPPTNTWPTFSIWASFCCRIVEAMS